MDQFGPVIGCHDADALGQACRHLGDLLLQVLLLQLPLAFLDAALPALREAAGGTLTDLVGGKAVPANLLSANAYLGAEPIARALDAGADIVITGRSVDSAVTLGALIHHFGWRMSDFDRLAGASLAGHIIECGCQATGGLFTDWDTVPDWAHIGYPIVECAEDGSFTVTLFLGNEGRPSFATLGTMEAVRDFFATEFPSAVPLMPEHLQDFARNPTGLLATLRLDQWHIDGRALLVGDAAHAIVPFHGQGMNCAFEDCVELLDLIESRTRQGALDWQGLFADFELARRPNAHAIAEMALENYVEMRDSVADPGYQMRRQLELALAQRLPGHFIPRYSMVMFTSIPYSLARERGEMQRVLLRELSAGHQSLDQIDLDAAVATAAMRLPKLC